MLNFHYSIVSIGIMLPLYGLPMIYLASKSPRRQELLTQLGVDFEVIEVDVHEARQNGELPADYVNRVAREKAGAALLQLPSRADILVLAADTDVVLDGHVLGKPTNAEQAQAMLKSLAGRSHQVITAVWLVSPEREMHCVVHTQVRFADISDAEISSYIQTQEPFGKAGGYAVQGKAAAFIESIEGSYSGVMGLPLHETYQLLRNFHLPAWSR